MNGCFLKFYVAENRRHRHLLAYEWLLEEAKRFGLHGGSAFRALATQDEADRFLAHLAAAGFSLFYIRVPVEFGFTGEERRGAV